MNRPSKTFWNLLALPLTLSVSACSHFSAETRSACAIFSPITYSQLDTPATVKQIEQHDVRWMRLCGKP